ncbi:hypothetical protein HYP99_gp022 [Sinorhizobium phage ort11]|uniref:Uncharacterized protein n=1 Tax=Sinorhizobium phage ort11 TaxID=2599764 RepID=A0A5C2H1Z4_9CAUD|nr:hypothetical protein HYP99_gp022 [Sinorhizobium phage ort11]QEP29820.1 hypothetical protein Smphiort11_022 [Sinorhizobium phage ort11]
MKDSFHKYMEDPKILTLILAAQRVCNSITEEQIHQIANALPDTDQTEFAAAMIDLGYATQDLEQE